MGLDVLLDAWGELEGSLPQGSTLLLIGDGPLREQLSERAGRPPLARPRARARPRQRRRARRRLPRRRRRGGADGRAGGLRAGGAGGRRLRHAQRRQRRRRAGRGGAGARPLAGGARRATRGRWRGACRRPPAGVCPSRDRTRAFRRGALAGRRWPTATARCTARCWRARPTRARGSSTSTTSPGCPAGRSSCSRLLPHLRGVNAHVILGEDGPAGRQAREGRRVRSR